jgi:hypothetical protein
MPESPPRLASADPGAQPGYAPVSWTAVASLALAVLFALVLTVTLYFGFRKGQLVIEPPLLFFPAVVIILAFVARRQIRASEGTRVGERYANWAWWIAMICGVGYGTYLWAIDFSIRRDAHKEFETWAGYLKKLNPSDPRDENFYNACHMTLDPGVRASVPPSDPARMDSAFRDYVVAFRNSDVIRVCGRNPGAVKFDAHGLRDWQQKPTEITCTLGATLVTPEGEHELVVPMRAVIDEKTKRRRWQIAPTPSGYLKTKKLTLYGWLVEYLEASGRQFAFDLMAHLNNPGGAQLAYMGFIDPGSDPQRAGDLLKKVSESAPQRGGVAGAVAAIVSPSPAGALEYLTQKVFTRPGGGPLDPSDLSRFVSLWNTPGKLVPAGAMSRSNPEKDPVLSLEPDAVECRMPIEIALGGSQGPSPLIARGLVVMRTTAAADPRLFADLTAARQAGASAGLSDRPPSTAEFVNRRVPWRVVRIESDLRPLPSNVREMNMPLGPGGVPNVP